jgi:PilZ domain-containing protein
VSGRYGIRRKAGPDKALKKIPNQQPQLPELADNSAAKLVHLALSLRWSPVSQPGRASETACTYDIHPRGARLLSSRPVSVGDLIVLERGRTKSLCQVIWTADPASPLRGQFSVRCVEDGKTPWDDELRTMQEQYHPVLLEAPAGRTRGFSRPDPNRRRRPRFEVEGQAEVFGGVQIVQGEVQELSEFGARIAAGESLRPGTDFRLMLNVLDVTLALKAQVKYLVQDLAMGVEFQEIRRGDRPLLEYVLSRLKTRRVEEFCPVEVVTEPLVAVG